MYTPKNTVVSPEKQQEDFIKKRMASSSNHKTEYRKKNADYDTEDVLKNYSGHYSLSTTINPRHEITEESDLHSVEHFCPKDLDATLLEGAFNLAPKGFKAILFDNKESSPPLLNYVFLSGEPGSGKTTLGYAAAWYLNRSGMLIDCANIRTEHVASGPTNFRNVIIPRIQDSTPGVIIADEITALTNGKENAMAISKMIDVCAKAKHLFFVFTINYPKAMPKLLKERLLVAYIVIEMPNIEQLKKILLARLKNDPSVFVSSEVEAYITTHEKINFKSYRDLESFLTRLLLQHKYKNHHSTLPLTKELIQSTLEKMKKICDYLDYNAPDPYEQK